MRKFFPFTLFILFMMQSHAQNVGIGTTAPAERLHVNGNVKADTLKPNAIKIVTNAGINKVLTSDAEGNAGWAELNSQMPGTSGGNVGFGLWGDCATNGSISDYLPAGDTSGMVNDSLGFSVSMSGEFAITGAPKADIGGNANQGAVFVYRLVNNKWAFFKRLVDPSGAAGDEFGRSVSINGNNAMVGSPRDNILSNADQGSVCYFQFNGTDWVFVQKITDGAGAANDNFGFSVGISGNKAIAGSPWDDVGANVNQGSVSFYEYNGTSWAFKIKMTYSSGKAGDNLGFSVAIDGDNAVAGAPFWNYEYGSGPTILEDQGTVIGYKYSGGNWANNTERKNNRLEIGEKFGYSVALAGNAAIVAETGYDAGYGRARIYSYGSTISFVSEFLVAKPTPGIDDAFGTSVAISGQYAIIGIRGDDISSNVNEGSASLFTKVGNSWQHMQFISDPAGSAGNEMGTSVSLDATTKRFMIGAPGAFGHRGKVLFGKIN
jgi:FG-GAP repeat